MGELFAGRYELLDPVATGGMGVVWRVLDRNDGQVKAAKILRQSDAGSLIRFVREQGLRVDHRHVVTPMSWAGVDDRVLFTMPLVRGGSVHDLIRRYGALPVRWSATLLDQTLEALEAVHAAGVVHRDVKPANLLLEPTGRGRPHLRLTDFGIAVPLDEPRLTRASQVIGSPGYMAPEQLMGADPDPRQDLYAAAMVAAETLAGTRPPAEGSTIDLSRLRGRDPVTDAYVDLLAWGIQFRPEDRPASAALMRQRLAATGALNLPPHPGEDIEVQDRYADLPVPAGLVPAPDEAPTGQAQRGVGTAELPDEATLVERRPVPPPRRRSPVSGILLILLGLIALSASAWLFLT
jgi:eukaryotic-like serine/threonine-protein kinase